MRPENVLQKQRGGMTHEGEETEKLKKHCKGVWSSNRTFELRRGGGLGQIQRKIRKNARLERDGKENDKSPGFSEKHERRKIKKIVSGEVEG